MSARHPNRLRVIIAAAMVVGSAGTLIGLACKVPNENHCLHKDADGNRWCMEQDPALPHCSPCEAANHGCVAEEPLETICPEYSATGTETGTETGT